MIIPPILSDFILVMELLVTIAVYCIIWSAYKRGAFMRHLAVAVLVYEVVFNISYMLFRLLSHFPTAHSVSPYATGLAIFHGVFSLVMFITLVLFFLIANRAYAREENYFKLHPGFTITFSVAWAVSILSGILLFIDLYLV